MWQNEAREFFHHHAPGGDQLMPKCREHSWMHLDGRWICEKCGEQAALDHPHIPPCPRCGARPEGDLIYCRVCLDRIYGLELQDA
jgi:rubrerythrin